ncbi:MAG: hypothetical protein WBQ55_04825 [Xanthobacteraceae bacterium]
MDDERRREAERQAAAKRALSPQVRADALRLVTEWNERQAQRAPLLFSPTIGSVSVNLAHSGTGTPFACSGLVNVQLGCGVMPSAKEYREYVDKCLGWAKSAKTDYERDIYLQMAKGWLEAALIANGSSLGPTAWTKPPSDEDRSAPHGPPPSIRDFP